MQLIPKSSVCHFTLFTSIKVAKYSISKHADVQYREPPPQSKIPEDRLQEQYLSDDDGEFDYATQELAKMAKEDAEERDLDGERDGENAKVPVDDATNE